MSEIDLDDDLPADAHELRRVRQRHRDRRAAEEKELLTKTSFTDADIEAYEQYERGQVARDLRRHERLVSNLEAFMQRDYGTFMERFSDKYARLTGATTA